MAFSFSKKYHVDEWMNYFEDRMPNSYFKLYEVPVRKRNYYNNQIEFNIMHNKLQMKGEVRISLLH